MRRFSLLCLVLFLAAVGTFLGAGHYGRNDPTGAWGAIVMVSVAGAALNYLRYMSGALDSLLLLVGLPIISVLLGHVGAFVFKDPDHLAQVIGTMVAVSLMTLVIAENSGVRYRWRSAVAAITTVSTGLVTAHDPRLSSWLTVGAATVLLLLLALLDCRRCRWLKFSHSE